MWKYDKRLCNGSPVVYFGLRLLTLDAEPGVRAMIEYALRTLHCPSTAPPLPSAALHCPPLPSPALHCPPLASSDLASHGRSYVFGVLEALGIRNGAVHSEVKTEERGPVLIEANCRLHGGEGTWAPMAEVCLGYSQVIHPPDGPLIPPDGLLIPLMACSSP